MLRQRRIPLDSREKSSNHGHLHQRGLELGGFYGAAEPSRVHEKTTLHGSSSPTTSQIPDFARQATELVRVSLLGRSLLFGGRLRPFFGRTLLLLLPGRVDGRMGLPFLDELDGVANVLRPIMRALHGV